ncbi:unnamed protein product [Peronospora destructor]|uniref:Uncharacterized protein n=1 Tax=Peronospora destructor TaxID=86335 RepID=A0AAV0V6U5_9STRA|nr:unnamed protein product [Peronospora destructor]
MLRIADLLNNIGEDDSQLLDTPTAPVKSGRFASTPERRPKVNEDQDAAIIMVPMAEQDEHAVSYLEGKQSLRFNHTSTRVTPPRLGQTDFNQHPIEHAQLPGVVQIPTLEVVFRKQRDDLDLFVRAGLDSAFSTVQHADLYYKDRDTRLLYEAATSLTSSSRGQQIIQL